MKNKPYLTVIGICLLTVFSFYYTNKLIEFSKSKDPIMIEIMKNKDDYNKLSIDALINNNYITPGSEGLEVDVDKSYTKMKKLGKYNDNLYVYDVVKPTISIKDNYNKFVINGNTTKKEVSLIFKVNDLKNIENINKILFNNNVSATFFIDGNIKDDDINILKILDESNNYFGNLGYNKKYSIKTIKYTNALLDRIDDDNHNYCYVEKDDINVLKTCSEVKMYTIKPMVVSNIFPFTYIKQNLENGKIFSLDTNSYTLKQLDLIIKYVRQKGYDFVTLEEILNEKINDKY
ncbi:MAG: hypothetical protein MR297_00815 [Tenericutes bacterium]|nr:hypothetical protein [Mycoplasmatota bacterium]